jgi:hypothetical protein
MKKPNNRLKIGIFTLIMIIIAMSSTLVSAASPNPSIGTAKVDGNSSEWNLSSDLFAGLYNGWDASKNLEANVYLRYNTSTNTLYVLVLAQPGYTGLVSSGDSWVAISSSDNGMVNNKVVDASSGNNGVPPDFAYVGQGYDGNSGHCQGYEASFIIAPGNWWIAVHLEVNDPAGQGQTAGTDGKTIPLILPPDFVAPETPFATTLIAIIAAAAVFAVYRRSQHKKQ